MATAWPWPYPESYAQAESFLSKLTVSMNRADLFHERDATGWQYIDLHSGKATGNFSLPDNAPRSVAYNAELGYPRGQTVFQNDNPAPASFLTRFVMLTAVLLPALTLLTVSTMMALGYFEAFITAAGADEFSEEDLQIWRQNFDQATAKRRAAFTDPSLGTNGVVCAQCHPNGANTHPENYPKYQKQLSHVAPLWQMIY